METVLHLTRVMRGEMKRQRPAELSLPQFRALRILQRHPGLSLSQLAARLDLTLASTSAMIELLVKHEMVSREDSSADRRKVSLQLRPRGTAALEATWQATQLKLGEILTTLSMEDQWVVERAMRALHVVLTVGDDDEVTHGAR